MDKGIKKASFYSQVKKLEKELKQKDKAVRDAQAESRDLQERYKTKSVAVQAEMKELEAQRQALDIQLKQAKDHNAQMGIAHKRSHHAGNHCRA